MAVNSKATVFLSGKLYWAKILGAPRPNYNGDAREWAFELELDDAGVSILKKHKVADRIKGKGFNIGQNAQFAERNPFILLKKPELSKDGNPNTPIRVYDGDDNEWDQSKLIGNGSSADVKLDIRDYGPGKKVGVYPAAVRVNDLVSYQSSEFGGMDNNSDNDEPVKAKDTFAKDFNLADELDDEIVV